MFHCHTLWNNSLLLIYVVCNRSHVCVCVWSAYVCIHVCIHVCHVCVIVIYIHVCDDSDMICLSPEPKQSMGLRERNFATLCHSCLYNASSMLWLQRLVSRHTWRLSPPGPFVKFWAQILVSLYYSLKNSLQYHWYQIVLQLFLWRCTHTLKCQKVRV